MAQRQNSRINKEVRREGEAVKTDNSPQRPMQKFHEHDSSQRPKEQARHITRNAEIDRLVY